LQVRKGKSVKNLMALSGGGLTQLTDNDFFPELP
jgi:hypothetical protein